MYQNDKLSTNNYLTKFSSLMRKILENSQHTAVPLIDELNAVELYLELESIRFKNKFDYSIELDEEIDTLMYKVPTMLIQPYVENAICHGLMHREDKGFLSIDIRLKPDHLSCIIIDNGIGREAAMEISKMKENNHSPLGTKITESRIDLINILYGSSLKTIYSDLKDEAGIAIGTKVEIQIPILT
jgi:LytS/YehU family sensor histidine kinase